MSVEFKKKNVSTYVGDLMLICRLGLGARVVLDDISLFTFQIEFRMHTGTFKTS